METDPSIHAIKTAWRSQELERLVIQLASVKVASDTFERQMRRSNFRQSVATIFIVVVFGAIGWTIPGWMMKLGAILTIVSVVYLMRHLFREGPLRHVPPDASAQALILFHRGQLVRQRDLLRTVWRWCLGPMLPGMVFILMGRWFQFHAPQRSLADDHRIIILSSLFIATVFTMVWLINVRRAAGLQRQIGELDRLLGE